MPFGISYGRKAMEKEVQKAEMDSEKYDQELKDLETIRLVAEKKEQVRKKKNHIKELKAAPRREFFKKLKKNVKDFKKETGYNKKEPGSVFGGFGNTKKKKGGPF